MKLLLVIPGSPVAHEICQLDRDFDVVRRAGRRVAVPVAHQACATSSDGILPDLDSVGVTRRPDFFLAPEALKGVQIFQQIGIAPVLQGLGTAMILTVIALVRDRNEQTEAAASAEVRALQSRMNPHFLFNALNTLAALAKVAPREVPGATGRLRQFLRAIFDHPERTLIPLEEELAVVRAYLDIRITAVWQSTKLKVEEVIGPGLTEVLAPPFSLQPLVENAVQHGLQSSAETGRLRLMVRQVGQLLEMSVSDAGRGVPSGEVERVAMLPQPPWLVFTTGNSGRATDAFRPDAVDYLLKPLDPKQVAAAVNRLLAHLRPFESNPSSLSVRDVDSVTTTDKRLLPGSENDLLVDEMAQVRELRDSGKASHGGHADGTELRRPTLSSTATRPSRN